MSELYQLLRNSVTSYFEPARLHVKIATCFFATIIACIVGASGTALVTAAEERKALSRDVAQLKEREALAAREIQRLRNNRNDTWKPNMAGDSGPSFGVVEIEDRQFDQITAILQGCGRVDRMVTCRMSFFNHGPQHRIKLLTQEDGATASLAVDDKGKEHIVKEAAIGNIAGEIDIPPHLYVASSITFTDVPHDVRRFTIIRLHLRVDQDTGTLNFRNVRPAA